jgi:hypothetical protein
MPASASEWTFLLELELTLWRRRTVSSGATRDFFVQPTEHHGTLGIDPIGLTSSGLHFWNRLHFPLALDLICPSFMMACNEIRLSFPKESP